MTKKYYLAINEDTIDLVTFLNDGVRPELKDVSTHLVFEINSPNEITTKVEDSYKVLGEPPVQALVVGYHDE
jgi:hypothetical protein